VNYFEKVLAKIDKIKTEAGSVTDIKKLRQPLKLASFKTNVN